MQHMEALEQKQLNNSGHNHSFTQRGVPGRTDTEDLPLNLLQNTGLINKPSHAQTPQTSQRVQFPVVPMQAGGTGTTKSTSHQEWQAVPPTAPSDIQNDGVMPRLDTLRRMPTISDTISQLLGVIRGTSKDVSTR